jgi:hypothetical protein
MPLTTQPLNRFASVTLDGSGNGIASLGPVRVREHWQLAYAAVAVATHVLEAQCQLYIGPAANAANFVSQTVTGSTGDTCALGGVDIQPGQQVFAKWTGGDANKIATITVNGTYSIGGPQ